MSLRSIIGNTVSSTGKYAESAGYYDRVPIRVNEFTLEENSEGRVVFETTAKEFCRNGPKLQITISKNDDGGWGVTQRHGAYGSGITPHIELHDERLARRRAMWHAT
jgi:hypothetical protein